MTERHPLFLCLPVGVALLLSPLLSAFAQQSASPTGQQPPAPASPGRLLPPSELWPKAAPPAPTTSQPQQQKPLSTPPPSPVQSLADPLPRQEKSLSASPPSSAQPPADPILRASEERERQIQADADEFVRSTRREIAEIRVMARTMNLPEDAVEATINAMEKDIDVIVMNAKVGKVLNQAETKGLQAEQKLEEVRRLDEQIKESEQKLEQGRQRTARIKEELMKAIEQQKKNKGSEASNGGQ